MGVHGDTTPLYSTPCCSMQAAFEKEKQTRDAAEAELKANITNLEQQKAQAEDAAAAAQRSADELSEELDAATAALNASEVGNQDLFEKAEALKSQFLSAQVWCFLFAVACCDLIQKKFQMCATQGWLKWLVQRCENLELLSGLAIGKLAHSWLKELNCDQ
jgi:hypothetical protein